MRILQNKLFKAFHLSFLSLSHPFPLEHITLLVHIYHIHYKWGHIYPAKIVVAIKNPYFL